MIACSCFQLLRGGDWKQMFEVILGYIVSSESTLKVREMFQWVKALAAKPDPLSLSPVIHTQ